MDNKFFGIGSTYRSTIPDAKRATGFGATQEPFEYINQALFELKTDHIIGTAAQLALNQCTCKYQCSDQTLRDSSGTAVTLTDGDRVYIIGMDTLTADFDLSAYDRLRVTVDPSISLANSSQSLIFGDESVLDIHCSSAAGVTVGTNSRGWINHDQMRAGKIGIGVLPGDMTATGFEVASGLTSVFGGNVTIEGDTVTNGGLIVNQGGGDYDTRVEGSGEDNLLVCNAGTDNVGIGIASPANRLHVHIADGDGDGTYVARFANDDVDNGFGVLISAGNYATADNALLVEAQDGTDLFKVQANGIIRFPTYSNGTLSISSGICTSSDRNMKNDDGTLSGAEAVEMLKTFDAAYFYWKDTESYGEDRQLGFYAQDINAASPEAATVRIDEKGGELWGIYDRAVAAIHHTVLQNIIERLEANGI